MANLPRFGRAWQRHSTVARPAPAVAHPASEPEPEILPFAPTTQTLQPFESNPPPTASPLASSPLRESTPRLSSPAKKAASPSASPSHRATVARVASPPIKPARSPPVSPAHKPYDGRHAVSPNSYKKTIKPVQTTPPQSTKSRRIASPPLSPLALPRTQMKSADGTAAHSWIPPEVEHKSVPYKKTAEKPAKSDRQSEYGSGKPPQKQQAEVINLTGHNVGAVMEISQFSDKSSGGEIIKKKETEGRVHGNDERETGAKDKSHRANGFPTTTFMNSNFQEANNSVMYDSSCSGRDPGLHLAFSRKPTDDGYIFDGDENSRH